MHEKKMTDLISNNDKTRSRGWCYTINNPTEEDENFAYNLAWGAKYTICGREIAPETGTIHLQGYVYFENPKFFTAIKALHPAAHWEAANGTPAQNQVYCSKDGDYFEWGTPPMSQEKKGDVNAERWDLALKAVQENRWEDVPTDIGARYGKGLEWFANKVKPYNLEDTEESMYWYYGGPATGKSRKAREDNPEAYIKMCNKWWDDY
uniref:hypothetical protein n=1 Tax=Yoonia sp. TaxID=2212373 RepID=UPI004048C2DA